MELKSESVSVGDGDGISLNLISVIGPMDCFVSTGLVFSLVSVRKLGFF